MVRRRRARRPAGGRRLPGGGGRGADRPLHGASPRELAALAAKVEPFPEEGAGLTAALDGLGRLSLRHGVDPGHPACAAHLHCQPLAAAVAADALVGASNQSLDSWDQAPVATHLEQRLVEGLAARVGWDPEVAGGVVTSGGTQSNLMGLLLARDAAAARSGRDAAADGLGPDAGRWRVLCSELAHFSVARSAALLGLGGRAVVPLGVDADRRLHPASSTGPLTGWTPPARSRWPWSPPPAPPTSAASTRCRPWPSGPARPACGCTSTPPGAAGCCSATATAACWRASRRPTRWPSTSTSCCGSRPAAAPSWSATGPCWPRWR